MPTSEFRYFKSVPGRAVTRFGSSVYIGATLGKEGFRFDPGVIRVPTDECRRFTREYHNAVKRGDLVEVGEADYDAWVSAPAVEPAPGDSE